jgi:putative flippase GtrA
MDPLSARSPQNKSVTLARQFSSFLAVGVVGTSLHYSILAVLVEAWHVNPVWATTVGFLSAALLSYVLNWYFTFYERPVFYLGLIKYYGAGSVGLALNGGTMAFLIFWGIHYFLAQVISSGIALFWNFSAARFVIFKSQR